VSHLGSLLVVDDEPEVADVLRDFFEGQGYAVNCALNGRDALVLASLSRPDAVILDIRLPERSGPEILADLRGLDDSVPVVMLSGTDDEALACDLLKAGAFDYVRKPFMLDNLEQVVGLAMLVGKRKVMTDDGEGPWPCDSRSYGEGSARNNDDTTCVRCHQPIRIGDTTAVREREGFYHAPCWLSRFPDVVNTPQLARS
jgi:DNA-binding response OmpR family regulator